MLCSFVEVNRREKERMQDGTREREREREREISVACERLRKLESGKIKGILRIVFETI